MNNIQLLPNPANLTPPQNESPQHFYLKQIATLYLKLNHNCRYIATEVKARHYNIELNKRYPNIDWYAKTKTDAIGIQFPSPRDKNKYMREHGRRTIIRNVEVKVSKSDYCSGYNVSGDYNYIMTPVGTLGSEQLPKPIGLIEVDIDSFKIIGDYRRLEGVSVVKNPRYLRREYDESDEADNGWSRKNYVQRIKNNMLRRYSQREVYRNMWVYERSGE